MNKRGQSQFLSIGVIFSIIVIIAILGISIYVIVKFLGIGACADLGLFNKDFQDSIDRAWGSEIVKDNFVGSPPRGVESICFGEGTGSGNEYNKLRLYQRQDANMFIYPPDKACGAPWNKVEHVEMEFDWRCFPVENGKVVIGLEKGSFDDLVRIRGRLEATDTGNRID